MQDQGKLGETACRRKNRLRFIFSETVCSDPFHFFDDSTFSTYSFPLPVACETFPINQTSYVVGKTFRADPFQPNTCNRLRFFY